MHTHEIPELNLTPGLIEEILSLIKSEDVRFSLHKNFNPIVNVVPEMFGYKDKQSIFDIIFDKLDQTNTKEKHNGEEIKVRDEHDQLLYKVKYASVIRLVPSSTPGSSHEKSEFAVRDIEPLNQALQEGKAKIYKASLEEIQTKSGLTYSEKMILDTGDVYYVMLERK